MDLNKLVGHARRFAVIRDGCPTTAVTECTGCRVRRDVLLARGVLYEEPLQMRGPAGDGLARNPPIQGNAIDVDNGVTVYEVVTSLKLIPEVDTSPHRTPGQ